MKNRSSDLAHPPGSIHHLNLCIYCENGIFVICIIHEINYILRYPSLSVKFYSVGEFFQKQ